MRDYACGGAKIQQSRTMTRTLELASGFGF